MASPITAEFDEVLNSYDGLQISHYFDPGEGADFVAETWFNPVLSQALNMPGWLEDPAVFAETLRGVQFYDSARNQEYFGTPDNPGQIHQTAQYGINIWSSLGALDIELTPADVIRHDLWVE